MPAPDNGLIFAINASTWTVAIPILLHGTDAQKRRHLPGLCDGSIVGANGGERARGRVGHLRHARDREADRRRLGPRRPQDLGDERPGGRPLRLLRLDGADFSHAGLGHVTFRFAKLRGANFSDADLTSADFTGADLTGADFSGSLRTDSTMAGAILTGARGLE